MSQERVFNLTDVSTPLLVQFGLVNSALVVGRALISPGGNAEVVLGPEHKATIDFYLSVGAVSLGKLPPTYALKKDEATPKEEVPSMTHFKKKGKKGK